MQQSIIGYHQDEEGHWVADLRCGHGQHVRHQPPMTSRPWVSTEEGRRAFLGTELNCKKCEEEGEGSAPPRSCLKDDGGVDARDATAWIRNDAGGDGYGT